MKVLGFGAVLWDDIVDAEAPAPESVVGEANIGGAVFNVVVHLRRLGYAAYMLSAIGRDPLGERTWREVERLGIHRDFISTVDAPTCLIKVTFDRAGFPNYSSPDAVSWDQIEPVGNLSAASSHEDARERAERGSCGVEQEIEYTGSAGWHPGLGKFDPETHRRPGRHGEKDAPQPSYPAPKESREDDAERNES